MGVILRLERNNERVDVEEEELRMSMSTDMISGISKGN
jgi:hypothetical protein